MAFSVIVKTYCETDGSFNSTTRNSSNVVCPVIDVIDTESLEYVHNGYFAVGGFDWNLQFNWHAVPEHENKEPYINNLKILCQMPMTKAFVI